MKQRMLLYGFTLLLGVFALSSCVNEDSVCLPEGSDVKVAFSLVLPENAQTRAAWSAEYDKELGVDYDNYIDLNGIQVLVFENTSTGTYAGTVTNFMYSKTGENVYTYFGDAPADLNATGTYKFVVLANCSKVTGLTIGTSTISALDNITYSLANMEYIPMWGVHKATLNLKPGQQYNIGDIDLLRAMSKVTVQLSQDMITRGFTLENLKVDNYNIQGFATPTNASSVAETTELDQELCIRPLTSAATNLPGTVNNNSVELYLPEYKNTPEAVTPSEGSDASGDESTTQTIVPATMSVTLKYTEEVEVIGEDGNPTTETFVDEISFPAGIKFINYEKNGAAIAGSDYDIVRNHHYIFTITGAEVGHRLLLTVQTIPWDDERMTVDYTETISWNGSELLTWIPALTEENSYIIDKEGDEYDGFTVFVVSPGDTPTCSFTLNAPQGWRWRAQLEPLTDGADEYITFLDGSLFKEGSVGQQATLNFKIQTGNTSVQHQSRLRLYVRSGDNSLEVKTLKFIISRNN